MQPDDARTDGDLVEATARGDDAAFAVLVRRYIRRATLLAAQLLGARNDAEDVVQEAFVVVHRSARTFDQTRSFATWFFAILRRLAANQRARNLRRARLLRFWWRPSNAEPASRSLEASLVAGLDAAAARRAMGTLSPMQRACFELVAVRGLSTGDAAAMHGIAESTVRQHVFRARAALRDALARTHGNDGERR